MNYEAGFPKQMHHPQHAPAVIRALGNGDMQGTAMRYPPEMAHTMQHEQELRARGYIPVGEAQKVMTVHEEYPMMMMHPDHVDAVPDQIVGYVEAGVHKTHTVTGKPEIMPHRIVVDAADERAWAARGYARPGRSDPAAFDRATTAPGTPGSEWPKWVDGVLMQDPSTPAAAANDYPRWVVPPGGEGRVVDTREAHEALCGPLGAPPVPPAPAASSDLDMGEYREFLAWKAMNASAPTATAPAPRRSLPRQRPSRSRAKPGAGKLGDFRNNPERPALQAQCKAAGVFYDQRWGVAKLREALATAAPQPPHQVVEAAA